MTGKPYGTVFQRLRRNDGGAALAEYALLLSFITVAVVGLDPKTGATLGGMFDDIAVILKTINGLMTEGHDYIS